MAELLRCWTVVDRSVISKLREKGWRIEKTKTQPIIEGVFMVLKAQKGRWLVLAPDVARLWDIAVELDALGNGAPRSSHHRYLAFRFLKPRSTP